MNTVVSYPSSRALDATLSIGLVVTICVVGMLALAGIDVAVVDDGAHAVPFVALIGIVVAVMQRPPDLDEIPARPVHLQLAVLVLAASAAVAAGTVVAPAMRREMIWGGIDHDPSAGLGAWRHCPCRPPTTADPEPFLCLFHDGGDVRVVYIPSRDVVLAMRFSRPLYDEQRIADSLDDVVFAVADRRGRRADSGG